MANPLLIAGAINAGSQLLGSIFGGQTPQEQAQRALLRFGKSGLPPEIKQQIIQDALASINQGVRMEKRGVAGRLAAGGIDSTSGLAQSQLEKVARAGLQQRGQAIGNINLQEERMKLDALRAALGGGDATGLNPLETLTSISGNLLPVLASQGGGGVGGGGVGGGGVGGGGVGGGGSSFNARRQRLNVPYDDIYPTV